MSTKADQIRSDVKVTTDQICVLNTKLQRAFLTTHHTGQVSILVDLTSTYPYLRGDGQIKRSELLDMAHWIIEMLEEPS